MKILIICFFTVFFLMSFIGIVFRLNQIIKKDSDAIIKLYNNSELTSNLREIRVGRLSDSSVRSSVRYHKSMYKEYEDYEKYRDSIRKLELP